VGRREALLAAPLPEGLPPSVWSRMVNNASPGDKGAQAETSFLTGDDSAVATVVAAVLPEACSRHNSPLRAHAITSLVSSAAAGAGEDMAVLAILEDASYAAPAACAIARAFPLFSLKSGSKAKPAPEVRVAFSTVDGPVTASSVYSAGEHAAEATRLAARLVDTPPEELSTSSFVEEARSVVERLAEAGHSVGCTVIEGEALRDGGYGGLWGVGKAALDGPRLVELSYTPSAEVTKTVCLVGKGITYDTGGLSLKTKDGMPGMKSDCGGAAALLAAFEAAIAIGTSGAAVYLLLCLAENAIGPKALRNDDIVRCLSDKTCEINNTDAEGRVVLADGIAHATADPPRLPGLAKPPDLVIDMATLTGAQMIATGKRLAAVVANTDEVEAMAVAAGKRSGDLVHPLPYVPEFFRSEFASPVADMKNSVKDRANAQSSCAAIFIGEHIHEDYEGGWLHVDLAGPSFIEGRGTGYGVPLTLALLGVEGFA